MNNRDIKLIYKRLKNRGIKFNHVCEVGVYLPETSNIINFIKDGIRTTLVEADPDTVERIKEYFSGYNIEVVPVAVWDTNGVITLSKAAASTFVTALEASPAIVNDKYQVKEENTFEVPCCVFSEIDDGSIDLLSVDIEGGEWYVIKYLKSRPNVISIETHGKYYINPKLNEIREWMKGNGYKVWYKDKSDSIFVRPDIISITWTEKLETFGFSIFLTLRRMKGILLGRINFSK